MYEAGSFGLALLVQSPPGLMQGRVIGTGVSVGELEGDRETVGAAVGVDVGLPVRSQKVSSCECVAMEAHPASSAGKYPMSFHVGRTLAG